MFDQRKNSIYAKIAESRVDKNVSVCFGWILFKEQLFIYSFLCNYRNLIIINENRPHNKTQLPGTNDD